MGHHRDPYHLTSVIVAVFLKPLQQGGKNMALHVTSSLPLLNRLSFCSWIFCMVTIQSAKSRALLAYKTQTPKHAAFPAFRLAWDLLFEAVCKRVDSCPLTKHKVLKGKEYPVANKKSWNLTPQHISHNLRSHNTAMFIWFEFAGEKLGSSLPMIWVFQALSGGFKMPSCPWWRCHSSKALDTSRWTSPTSACNRFSKGKPAVQLNRFFPKRLVSLGTFSGYFISGYIW